MHLCALRTHRRTWGLSQKELADLLGFESPTQVSRIEHGKRVPRLETALACAALFGVSVRELFPQLFAKIGTELRERIAQLPPLHTITPAALRKWQLLKRALDDAGDEAPHV
jgi:transcriptional regulator with XRE-family HTH domain